MHPLLADLAHLLPASSLITDPATLAPRLSDMRKKLQGQALALALPDSTEQVAAIVRLCRQHGVSIVPQGGNTGLVGGATPLDANTLLLGSDKLNRIRAVDPVGYSITVEAGCILDDVHGAAAKVDRLFPLWLGSSGSARIGGLIGTNAGGMQVLRYGTMRELVLGIEAVLPDGRVYQGLHALRKRNIGYDLKQWFIGAEGTLGFVTAATLRLFPAERGEAVAMVALPDADAVLALFAAAKARVGEVLTAFEMLDHESFTLMARHFPQVAQPFDPLPRYAALIALTGGETDAELETRLTELLADGDYSDAVLAQDSTQRAALWSLREWIPDAQRKQGPSIKHDLALPIAAIPAFMREAAAAIAKDFPAARPIVFGHVGDGNLHYNLGLSPEADFYATEARANALLFPLARAYGGEISAEHGIGRFRREQADQLHDPVERALMRELKQQLDPDGLFNPGVLI
ncbi:FAD-binding oxidoreductase [Chitinimonas sp. BJYL2]|uniref:FAD-binding oxidoreductase n=1 Tax=Chitinimonas sp. BJYL2 TaxID=2976696 RepID=UPI0022B3EB04|nr:FAD-binding oxidoreductase [Chitinimonas sp. BJYL2]